jgi:hypothetical protein
MNRIARNWRVLAGGMAAGSVAVLGLTGTSASADPTAPEPPAPAPVTVTVTVTPQAAAAPAAADPSSVAAVPATAATAPPAQPLGVTSTPSAAPAPTAVATTPAAQPLAAATTPPPIPATSGTLAEFFKDKGVVLEPQKAAGFTALNITLPVPTGWTVVPDPNVPDAFSVIADRKGGDALYTPNAQVKVYKLVGDFDPREAISHGYVDSQALTAWQQTDASMAEFSGFPASEIEGTYRDTDVTLNTTRRNLIAQAGPDRYLVSLYVTTAANQVVATATSTEAILKGFKVGVPGSQPAVAPPSAAPVIDAAAPAAPPAAPAPAAAPAVPAAPAPVPVADPAPAAAPPAAVPAPAAPPAVPTP